MNSTDQEILKDTDELDWSLNLNDFELSLIQEIISDGNETLPIPSVPTRRYRGVYRRPSGNYTSEFRVGTKRLWLGTYKTAEAAAMAYDQAAFKSHGPNAMLNFPHLIGKSKPSPELGLGLEGSPETSSNNHHLRSANFPIGETLPDVSDANRVVRKRGLSAGQCKKVVSGGKIKPISGERYRGVGLHGRRFSAKIRNSETRMWLGTYDTSEEAAMAYDQAAFKYHGSRAVLNFPHLIGKSKPSPELELEGSPELELEGSPESSSNNHLPELANFRAMGETPTAVSDLKGVEPKRGFSAGFCEEMVSGNKYRGVGPHGMRFSARITIRNSEKKRENLWLGTYDTAEEAATAFDQAAVRHRGSRAVLNFPHLIGKSKRSSELELEGSPELELEGSPESSSNNHLPELANFRAMGETPPTVSDLKGVEPKRGFSAGLCEEMVSGNKYRGVGLHGRRFSARITIRNSEKKRENLWLGTYDTAEEAAMAFDQAAVKYRGSATMLNFPHLIGDDKLSPELESSPESSSDNHHLNGKSAAAV